jgi:anthranilate phosphoribosyltransferase
VVTRPPGCSHREHRHPNDFGLDPVSSDALAGGDPITNARIVRSVLDGEPGARRTAVLLNAAAGLVVAEVTSDLREAATLAANAIDSGRARQTLERWVIASNAEEDEGT